MLSYLLSALLSKFMFERRGLVEGTTPDAVMARAECVFSPSRVNYVSPDIQDSPSGCHAHRSHPPDHTRLAPLTSSLPTAHTHLITITDTTSPTATSTAQQGLSMSLRVSRGRLHCRGSTTFARTLRPTTPFACAPHGPTSSASPCCLRSSLEADNAVRVCTARANILRLSMLSPQ
jgi:hypothetical protein